MNDTDNCDDNCYYFDYYDDDELNDVDNCDDETYDIDDNEKDIEETKKPKVKRTERGKKKESKKG